MKVKVATIFSMIIATMFLFSSSASAFIAETQKSAGVKTVPTISSDCAQAKNTLFAAYHNRSPSNLSRMRRLLTDPNIRNCKTIPQYLYPSNWDRGPKK